ncbi:hypothetical protein C8Q75DRAFT_890372, partial [Abortiporus biennis]
LAIPLYSITVFFIKTIHLHRIISIQVGLNIIVILFSILTPSPSLRLSAHSFHLKSDCHSDSTPTIPRYVIQANLLSFDFIVFNTINSRSVFIFDHISGLRPRP